MYGNTDDYKDVFNNERQNRNIMQQLASGIPQNSETSKFISKYSNLFQSIKGNSASLFDAPQDFIANMFNPSLSYEKPYVFSYLYYMLSF